MSLEVIIMLTLKGLETKFSSHKTVEKSMYQNLTGRFTATNNIAPWVKRGDKYLQDTQLAFFKATVAFMQISEKLLRAEGGNQVVKTKEILSSALDGVLLLGSMSQSLKNLCRERIKPTLIRELQCICDTSNAVANYFLGSRMQRKDAKKTKDAKKAERIISSSSSYIKTPRQSNVPFN